jgi:hypothetical protein
VNALGHQKVIFAAMSGTQNVQTVHSYTASPFAGAIWDNTFEYITVNHGGC